MRAWPALLFAAALFLHSPAPAIDGAADVVDGDTLKIGGATIRLQGIDAPEARQNCTDRRGSEWTCGRSATRALAKLAAGANVHCEPVGKDGYGRVLALCRAGAVDINRRLVSDGWAYAFVKYDERYVADEQEARRAGRGIWQGRSEAPWDWRAARATKVAEASPGNCAIKGNVSPSGERVYHLPWQQAYEKTRISAAKGERWFCSEEEALKAGWRRALR